MEYKPLVGRPFPSKLEEIMTKSMSPAEITQLRDDLGGNTLLAIVSGTRNRHDAEQWVNGELTPTASQLERFAVAREIFDRVAEQDGALTARQLFAGENTIVPRPRTASGKTVIEHVLVELMMAIRDGHFEEARIAAQKSLDCEWI